MASEDITSYLFTGSVSYVEERFEDFSVREEAPSVVEGGQRFYRMERRSRGWFAICMPFGIALCCGPDKPEGIVRGSLVEIKIWVGR